MLTLTTTELGKFKRKINIIIPCALIILFGAWAAALAAFNFNTSDDARLATYTIVNMGSVMLPLLTGSTALIFTGIDRTTGMLPRLHSLGFKPLDIGLSKAAWVFGISVVGVAVIIAATLAFVPSGVSTPTQSLIAVTFMLIVEAAALTTLFVTLSLRSDRSGRILGLALVGTLLGSASAMIPKVAAVLIPFTLVGGTSAVGISINGPTDTPISIVHIGVALLVAVTTATLSLVALPQRFNNAH